MHIHSKKLRGAFVAGILIAGAAAVGMRGAGEATASAPVAGGLVVQAARAESEAGYDQVRRFVGRVEFAQASAVSFEVGGQVARVRVDEGDRVEAGAVVAELDTARLRARRAELAAARDEARARIELARLRDGRAQELLAEDVISSQRADDARLEAEALAASLRRVEARIEIIDVDLEKARLRAPFAGRVAERFVDPGVVVRAGEPVVRLLETHRPEVRVGVSADVARRLAEGERLELTIDGRSVAGAVLAVLPERRSETRTVAVRIALEGADPTLREGDLAELVWRRAVASEGFWLPRAALTEGARGLWAAYVASPAAGDASGPRTLERRPVEILHESGERVFVRGGLRTGDAVVQDGVHRLVPGQLVQVESPTDGAALAMATERLENEEVSR